MTTIAQQLELLVATYVEADWPGSGSVTGYYDPVTMTITPIASVPAPVDYVLYGVIKAVLETEPIDQEFRQDMTSGELKSMTQEAIDRITKHKARVDALVTHLQTYHDALP